MKSIDSKLDILKAGIAEMDGYFSPEDNITWDKVEVKKDGVLDRYTIEFTVFEKRDDINKNDK